MVKGEDEPGALDVGWFQPTEHSAFVIGSFKVAFADKLAVIGIVGNFGGLSVSGVQRLDNVGRLVAGLFGLDGAFDIVRSADVTDGRKRV